MPLESVTYISDLVATNPVNATDQVAQGDDHIRNIKTALLNSFPGVTGAVTSTHAELNILDGVTLTAAQINDAARKSVTNTFAASQNISVAGAAADLNVITTTVHPSRVLFQTNSGTRAIVGASSGASSIITGDALGDLVLRIVSGNLVVSGDNGTTINFKAGSSLANSSINGVAFNDFARLSQANTFAAAQGITAANAKLDLSDPSSGDASVGFTTQGQQNWTIGIDRSVSSAFVLAPSSNLSSPVLSIATTGAVTTNNTSASEVGFKGAPARTISASTNTAATDAGGTVRMTGGSGQTFTLDADPPADSVVVLDNASGNSWAIAASGTLTWASTGGTGSRTLANGGMAVALHSGSGNWKINGGGLT